MKIERSLLIIIFISSFLIILSFIPSPREREFRLNDLSIQKRHKHKESIKIETVTLISILAPFIVFFFVFRKSNLDLEMELQFYIVFMTCHLMIIGIVENSKLMFGRLRPDFLDRCIPVRGICTGNPKMIKEGRKSFPSGHSATAAIGFSFLAIFLHSKFNKMNILKIYNSKKIIPGLTLICVVVPFFIGLSRYVDNRHFITDILAGITIGTLVSYTMYINLGSKLLEVACD